VFSITWSRSVAHTLLKIEILQFSAQEAAMVLYNKWLGVHGVPSRIHSDHGVILKVNYLKSCWVVKNQEQRHTTLRWRGVERNNRTIISVFNTVITYSMVQRPVILSDLCNI